MGEVKEGISIFQPSVLMENNNGMYHLRWYTFQKFIQNKSLITARLFSGQSEQLGYALGTGISHFSEQERNQE